MIFRSGDKSMIRYAMFPIVGCLVLASSDASRAEENVARLIYLAPSDREFRQDYENAIWHTVVAAQTWYYGHLNGKTFLIKDDKVEKIRSAHDTNWFTRNAHEGADPNNLVVANAPADVTSILGGRKPEETWVIYVDAPGASGVGYVGGFVCVMLEHDLIGLTKGHNIGGSAHEIGHSFGLPHAGDKDPDALMRSGGGFTKFPACYLTDEDVATLSTSRFFVQRKPRSVTQIVLVYDGGCFVELPGGEKWQEWKTKDGAVLDFERVDKTSDTAVIVDKSRNIYLIIPIHSGQSYFSLNNTTSWKRLYDLR